MTFHRWIVRAASWLVPSALRSEWRAEWDAELHHRESARSQWSGGGRVRTDLVGPSIGAFWDALWLQSSRWYSLRIFGRHWRMALTAVLSLSVAIAALVIGLAAYNALLFRPPSVGNPETLLFIHSNTPSEPFGSMSFAEYTDYQRRLRSFAEVAAFPYSISSITFRNSDRTDQVLATQVSNNFFAVLGVAPRFGTLALRSDGDDGIVISSAFWKKLGSDPRVIGATVRLHDQPVTIAGVVPQAFGGMTLVWEPDVWMSLKTAERVLGSAPSQLTDRTQRWLHLVGRLKPGVQRLQAINDVRLVAAQVEADNPGPEQGRSAVVTSVSVTPAGDRAWMSLLLGGLVLVVVLTLIIACANVTNLLLGLSTARRHEMLVRAALGASRIQLVAPMLRESLTLALASCVLGSAAASAFLVKLSTFKPAVGGFWPAPSINLRPDAIVFGITLFVTAAAGLVVGLAPAWRAASDGLAGSLSRELSTGEPRKARIRQVLVVIQMAVATLVLVGLGISVRSFVSLMDVSLGFSARHLVFAGIDLRRRGVDAQTGPPYYERIRQHVAADPAFDGVTLANNAPLAGFERDRITTDGTAPTQDGRAEETGYFVVDDRYFSVLGVSVLAGRTFDSRDRKGSPEVVMVNSTMAKRHWPGQNPIGQWIRIENGNRRVQVVGVVADGKYGDITEPQLPFMYFALGQHYLPDVTVIATPRRNSKMGREALVENLLDMEPPVILGGIGAMTLDDLLELSLLIPRTIVFTTLVFGILTVALAVFGLYSTVFYAVTQRTKEMGIRTALGAQPRDIFLLVFRQTGWVAVIGAALGVAVGMSLLPLAASIFFGIGPVEPVVLTLVALTSVFVTLTTTYAVARQWIGVGSIDMLRQP